MNRRDFLATGLTTLAGTFASESLLGSVLSTTHAAAPGGTDWSAVRRLFPLDPKRVHMTGLLLASNPKPVRDAIDRHTRELNRNPVEYYGATHDLEEQVRKTAARFLEVTPEEIALTDSTTMGLGLLYGGIRLAEGKEILTTAHDHYSTHESLDYRAKRGAKVRKVELYADSAKVTEDEVLSKLRAALAPDTRIFAATFVHSSTGVKLPIGKMADVIREANRSREEKDKILFCVDGVHGFGVENFTLKDLGCDFFSAGCHKWLFGPRGTGLLFGRTGVNGEVDPIIPSFSFDGGGWGARMTPGGFHSFEQRWALGKAFELHETIGRDKIEKRIHALNTQLKEGLAKLPKVKLYTPRAEALSSGLTCFDVEGMTPKEVQAALEKKGIIASTTPYKVSYARLTPGILNTPEEITKAVAAVRALG